MKFSAVSVSSRSAGRRGRDDDSGQLMMLAGIVITLSFILTALTLSQVSSLEREAAAETASPLPTEWRFLHERLASNIATAVTETLTLNTFTGTTFPTVTATFRNIEAEKGYDAILRLSGAAYERNELDTLVCTAATAAPTGTPACTVGDYAAFSDDGEVEFWETHAHTSATDGHDVVEMPYDGTNDGVLWNAASAECPTGASATGCIRGVFVYVKLSDGVNYLEESILFATNTD